MVEGDEPDAVGERICHLGGDVEGQPGLAHSTEASEGYFGGCLGAARLGRWQSLSAT